MKPLREDPTTPRGLAELLQTARELPEATPQQHAAVWRRINETADAKRLRRTNPWVIAGPALAAFALTVLIVPRLQRPSTVADPRIQLAANAHVAPASGAQFAVDGAVLALRSGSVTASPGARVHTPQLDIEVLTAHCTIQVAGEVTTIDLQDGELRAGRPGGPVLTLSGATRFRSDDPRLSRAPVAAAPTPSASAPVAAADPCSSRPQPERAPCYSQLAAGSDLAAQNAVYMLGQLEREAQHPAAAVEQWTTYERRFPEGALWPEAAAGILTERMAQSQWPEALAAAEAYLARVPSGGRSPEVGLIRANLLREHLGRVREALDVYRSLVDGGAPVGVRSEARFGQALAAQKLGLLDEAQSAERSYARDFPQGPHAAEVARMRAP